MLKGIDFQEEFQSCSDITRRALLLSFMRTFPAYYAKQRSSITGAGSVEKVAMSRVGSTIQKKLTMGFDLGLICRIWMADRGQELYMVGLFFKLR